MSAKIHAHLLSELDRSGRADTIFSICAVMFNMLVLCLGSIIASLFEGVKSDVIFYILIIGAAVVTIAALAGLINGQRMCNAYQMAFIDLYKKEQVVEYYPISAINAGKMRNSLYFLVITAVGVITISIPLIIHKTSAMKGHYWPLKNLELFKDLELKIKTDPIHVDPIQIRTDLANFGLTMKADPIHVRFGDIDLDGQVEITIRQASQLQKNECSANLNYIDNRRTNLTDMGKILKPSPPRPPTKFGH